MPSGPPGYGYLVKHHILYESQYGFRESHSTTNAISELNSHILDNFDKRKMTLSLFLDLSKAFDTTDHSILLIKLGHYGIRGVSHEWFKSYLQNRQQYVKYKTCNSIPLNVDCGVPQGSVLGSILFILTQMTCQIVCQRQRVFSLLTAQRYMFLDTVRNPGLTLWEVILRN